MQSEKGIKVVAVAQNPLPEIKENADRVATVDFNDPVSMASVFQGVEDELGIPNVVIYNAYSCSAGTGPNDLFGASIDGFIKDMNINTVTPLAAAEAAGARFATLLSNVHKTFIFTGNKANTVIAPAAMTSGMGKTASKYMIQPLVSVFKESGYRSYYVDKRTPEGKGTRKVSRSSCGNI